MRKLSASIIIPLKNAGPYFKLVLDKIFSQSFKNFEVLVIDSGSSDGTIELLRKYPLRLVKIKPKDFGHGKTRNYGASLAKGEYVVFLTQDSIPYDKNWLTNLLKPFSDPKIAGVYGRQVPKKNEKELDKYFFLSLYGSKDKTWTSDNYTQGDNIFSDANSAVRKSLLKKYPYKTDIIVSEDYEWAIKMLSVGYKIFYSKESKVIHSHTYNLFTLFKRNFDIGVSYKDIYKKPQRVKFLKKGAEIFKNEIKYLVTHKKIHLIPACIIRDAVRFLGVSLGKNEKILPHGIKKKYISAQRWYWV